MILTISYLTALVVSGGNIPFQQSTVLGLGVIDMVMFGVFMSVLDSDDSDGEEEDLTEIGP